MRMGDVVETATYYPQYCMDPGCCCSFVSDQRHAPCWCCKSVHGCGTINCFREIYPASHWKLNKV